MTLRITKVNVLLLAGLLAAGLGAGIVIAAVTWEDDDSPPDPDAAGNVTQARLDGAIGGLCDVSAAVEAGDAKAARAAFYDKAHLFLHQLAAEVQARNVDAATALLVAKYRVEDLLGPAGTPAEVDPSTGDAVRSLIDEVGQSARVLGLRGTACTRGG